MEIPKRMYQFLYRQTSYIWPGPLKQKLACRQCRAHLVACSLHALLDNGVPNARQRGLQYLHERRQRLQGLQRKRVVLSRRTEGVGGRARTRELHVHMNSQRSASYS